MSELLRTYRSCCAETIARWDGYIARYMGDGVLAYFSWPRSHEDDAERAIRAGLELVAAVGRLDMGETLFTMAEFRRDTADLRKYADAQADLCAEHSITLFGNWANFGQGLVQSWSGDPLEGIVAMRAALVAEKSAHVRTSSLFESTSINGMDLANRFVRPGPTSRLRGLPEADLLGHLEWPP